MANKAGYRSASHAARLVSLLTLIIIWVCALKRFVAF